MDLLHPERRISRCTDLRNHRLVFVPPGCRHTSVRQKGYCVIGVRAEGRNVTSADDPINTALLKVLVSKLEWDEESVNVANDANSILNASHAESLRFEGPRQQATRQAARLLLPAGLPGTML